MTSASSSKNPAAPLRRIGLHRYSTAEFLITLLLLLIGIPFVEQFDQDKHIETILMTLVLVSGVLAVGGRRRTLVLAVVLMLPALAGKWINHFWPQLAPTEMVYASGLIFLVFLIWQFLHFIMRTPRVNSEVMCAGVSIYLLLGLMWMFAYLLVAGAAPGAFAFTTGPATGQSLHGANAFYYSFITLCTVGYGDIVPVSNVARMLAAMEAITGTLYVAVLISRLVALYSSAGMQPDGQKD